MKIAQLKIVGTNLHFENFTRDGGDVENTTAIREKKLVEMPNYRLGKMTPIQSYLGNFEPLTRMWFQAYVNQTKT
jgi:hypothetical protein